MGKRAFDQPLGITISPSKEEGQKNEVGNRQADHEGQLPPYEHQGDPAQSSKGNRYFLPWMLVELIML